MRGLPHVWATVFATVLLSFLLAVEATAACRWWQLREPCFGRKPSLSACLVAPLAFLEAERAGDPTFAGVPYF
jgi:hypothetical protein